uniref:DUF5622 domain-containing protein n=1 Tax=Fervidicoccus fontis TaxID=683846 RepID=A0A7J3ZIP2_9CREN
MRGSKKKYVYIELEKGRFLKARVSLEGRKEPVITVSTDPSKIVVLNKVLGRIPRGYKIIKLEDLPEKLREHLKNVYSKGA